MSSASYSIELKKAARDGLAKVPQDRRQKVADKINALALDPIPPGAEQLSGTKDVLYRVRVGNYRIVYGVENERLVILVVVVGNRKDVYKTLKKLLG